MTDNNKYTKAAEIIKAADALLFTSGAGMGVDSGLPDFRGDEGFWKAYPPIAELGYSFIDMANPQWFKTNPHLAWAFYGHRFNLYRHTNPHEGFYQLLEMGKQAPKAYFVFTSNVDGQYQKAGYDSDKIAEAHGSIHHFQCADSCSRDIWQAPDKDISLNEISFKADEPLPACRNCGGLARPNILMFGDFAWLSMRTGEQEERLENFLYSIDKSNLLVVIESGAGSGVPTVRRFSERVSRRMNAPLIRINPREPHLGRSHPDSIAFEEGAGRAINNIYTQYNKLL